MSGELHIRRTFGEHSALFGGGLDERPFLARPRNPAERDTHTSSSQDVRQSGRTTHTARQSYGVANGLGHIIIHVTCPEWYSQRRLRRTIVAASCGCDENIQ